MTKEWESDVLTDSLRSCRYSSLDGKLRDSARPERQGLCREGGPGGAGWGKRTQENLQRGLSLSQKDAEVTFWGVSGTIF